MLLEIWDVAGPMDDAFRRHLDDVLEHRRMLPGVSSAESWLGAVDDSGSLGAERSRIVLLHDTSTPEARLMITGWPDPPPPRTLRRHVYDATTVSDRRVEGRADPTTAPALRFVAMNCAPNHESEFHAWYEEDHLPAFTDLPGVLAGRRLFAPAAPRKHLAIYWLASLDVVADPSWAQAAQTQRTAMIRPHTSDRDRINLLRPSGS